MEKIECVISGERQVRGNEFSQASERGDKSVNADTQADRKKTTFLLVHLSCESDYLLLSLPSSHNPQVKTA